VQHHLEAARAQQRCGLLGFGSGVTAVVELENPVVQRLRAHLYLGHAKVAQPGQLFRGDLVRAGLDHQADVAVKRGLVKVLGFRQGWRFDLVHGVETALDEPFLVVAAVGAPGAAKDQQLDFVGGVAVSPV